MSVPPDGTVADLKTSDDRSAECSVSIWFIRPGEYRFSLVDEKQGMALQREYPDGALRPLGDRFLWVIPVRYQPLPPS